MSARAPEPGDCCRPGNRRCEHGCNDKPVSCDDCGEELYRPSERSDGEDRCDECEALRQAQQEAES